MGNIFTWLRRLETFVINRRDDKYGGHHSEQNHLESLPSDNLTTETVSFTNGCSDFYLACRNNKIDQVKRFLRHLSIDEIDKIEPNGSTALHAACYHGHYEIVRLLLEVGADRAIPNKYKYLPFDEARTREIKKLFFRVPNSNRLVSNTGDVEWILINDDVFENAVEERQCIKSLFDNITGTSSIDKMLERIQKNYIEKGLAHFDRIENIQRFFEKATKDQDPKWIITAYTAETDFYKILNQEIACGASKYQNERRYIIALLSYHPKLDELSHIGNSYRVMEMNDDNLEKYQVNCSLMTKSFLSSAVDKKIAAWFLCRQNLAREQSGQTKRHSIDGKVIKQWVMCIYNIKRKRTALHIENSSQYANEGEILIMPYTVFQVKKIGQVKAPYLSDDSLITEIVLEECDY